MSSMILPDSIKVGDYVKLLKLPNVYYIPDLIGALVKVTAIDEQKMNLYIQVGAWEIPFPLDADFVSVYVEQEISFWNSLLDIHSNRAKELVGKFGVFANSAHDMQRSDVRGYLESIVIGDSAQVFSRKGDNKMYAFFRVGDFVD
jgi:hypothetical protein